MVQPALRNRIASRPVRWIIFLLTAVVLWIGLLRILLIIPTPADVDYEHSYFSPLSAPVFASFFRLNAPLLGWHAWFPPEKYKMTFAGPENSPVPEGGCLLFSGMYLDIAPGSLWGSFVHWEVRQIGICGEPE